MCCGQLKSDSLTDISALSPADLAPLDTAFWQSAQEELSSQGLRVLALCRWWWQIAHAWLIAALVTIGHVLRAHLVFCEDAS